MKKYIFITMCCILFSSSAFANMERDLTLHSIKQSLIVIFDVNKPKPIKY